MSENVLCNCHHVSVMGKQENLLEDLTLSVRKKELVALISEDESAGDVLKLIAGLYVPDHGKIVYPDMTGQDKTNFSKRCQYIPDDIVCYDGLRVKEFLHGMARRDGEAEAEAVRLLTAFGINEDELLLEMTFGHNRLVSIIQAMMARPSLLLMNRPYDMLGERMYQLLLKEMIRQYFEGTAIVIAAESFADVVMPCHKYVYLEAGRMKASFSRTQLPPLSKVITMWGGEISSFLPEKMELLVRRKQYVRFLYREQDMQELADRLGRAGCDNVTIEELSMEEELFHNYERWLS